MHLTFGEQVKIVLKRKGMTIKQLAEIIEETTDKKMSRQNLTQRLNRDNFQEQDMRMIAAILNCPFELSILGEQTEEYEKWEGQDEMKTKEKLSTLTIGDLINIQKEDLKLEETESAKMSLQELLAEVEALEREEKPKEEKEEESPKKLSSGWMFGRRNKRKELQEQPSEPAEDKVETKPSLRESEPQDLEKGEINPKTGEEYLSDTVRAHAKKIGYVQVYSRKKHQWQNMTEWAFMGEQERKKNELGSAYEPPIYLD